jgi:penicillin-binding protein 1C
MADPGRPVGPEGTASLFSAASVYLTFQALLEVNRPESQAGWEVFETSRKIAWKTGTSFGFRDAWAVGSHPRYTVGVWAGNADGEGRPGLTGISAAAPLLFDAFAALKADSWFSPPEEELFPLAVCRHSGFLPGPNCRETDTISVPAMGLHSDPCPYHIIAHLTPDGRFRVNRDCAAGAEIRHESWFVLPPVQEWYFRQKNPGYRTLPDFHPDCADAGDPNQMEMIYPRHSARVYVPHELDGSPGKVILEAAHRVPETLIHWHLDQTYLGSTRYIHQMGIRPGTGPHTLTLVDEHANTYRHSFEAVDR